MKNHIGAFALLLPLALAGVGSALAAEDDAAMDAASAKCSEATLHGTYLFVYEGFTVSGEGQGPFAVGGSEVYDGRGNVRSVSTSSMNGKISSFERTTGRYTVNADCSGSSIYSDGTRYDLFVAPDGSTSSFIQTNPGTATAGFEPRAMAHKVAAEDDEDDAAMDAAAATCSEATLHGTYRFAEAGFTVSGEGQGPRASAGQQVYDGRGQTRGVITVSRNGEITRFIHDTGKYTVNPDCTGSASFSSGTTGDLFIAPDGSQFVFLRTNPGSVVAGFGQRATARRADD